MSAFSDLEADLRWVIWKNEPQGRVFHGEGGRCAKPDDPSTWLSREQADDEQLLNGTGGGVGIQLAISVVISISAGSSSALVWTRKTTSSPGRSISSPSYLATAKWRRQRKVSQRSSLSRPKMSARSLICWASRATNGEPSGGSARRGVLSKSTAD